ncbi:MAG: hypothetical protein E7Z94_06735 [Actinomyces ruminicola]|nr:hypothetical protein [Actinomyces ruminicola]
MRNDVFESAMSGPAGLPRDLLAELISTVEDEDGQMRSYGELAAVALSKYLSADKEASTAFLEALEADPDLSVDAARLGWRLGRDAGVKLGVAAMLAVLAEFNREYLCQEAQGIARSANHIIRERLGIEERAARVRDQLRAQGLPVGPEREAAA